MLEHAIRIALDAHEGQVDKAGRPYILHPIRVMMRTHTETAMLAALLHDVVEDSDWTLERLRAEGFPENVVAAVALCTHGDDQTYEEFIEALKQDPVAREVKLADLEDNLDLFRLPSLNTRDLARVEKYHRAWRTLKALDGT